MHKRNRYVYIEIVFKSVQRYLLLYKETFIKNLMINIVFVSNLYLPNPPNLIQKNVAVKPTTLIEYPRPKWLLYRPT